MNKKILGIAAGVLSFAASNAWSATDWSVQDYSLYPGDFNGDGKTDLLYVAKDSSRASGIAISDASGAPNTSHQSWPSNYLGIPWSTGTYSVFVADFNGDGKADIFLQRNSPGNSYLLHANTAGKVDGWIQEIPSTWMGLGWTADQHKVVVGDFNADGKADLFFQATVPSGAHAVVLADSNGQFTGSVSQTWNDGYLGLNWSAPKAFVFAGKFNGDSRADLLVQARPKIVMVDFDISIPVPTYPPNMNGIAFSQTSGALFQLVAAQTWSRMANGVDWSPLTNNVVVGDFDGDGRDDVIFQKRNSSGSSYMLASNASGAAFASSPTALSSNVSLSGDAARLIAGNYDGSGGVGVYLQALNAAGTNYVANTYSGGSLTASAHNPATPTGVVPTTAVGHTVGSFAVSSNGAATYSIPIVVPPGIAGVQPTLAIEYRSDSGNGHLGIGWSLSGLSVIDRCTKTLVQDNEVGRVSLTSADAFCVDGNRLRKTNGVNYGDPDSTYQTERETFSRFTAKGTAGNGPAYFVMDAKDGLVYEYGNSGDSRIESVASGYTATARVWALSKVRDRAGNTMTIAYEKDAAPNGSYRPSEIIYTSNSGAGVSSGAYKVKFYWDTRPTTDPIHGYFAGGLVNETKRLNRLETQYNGGSGFGLVRKYQLSYNVSGPGQQSRLAAVQECDSSGNCLSPTMVSWQDGASGLGSPSFSSALGSLVQDSLPVDLNGDGRTDLVYPCALNWCFMLASASGGYGSLVDSNIAHNGFQAKAIPTDFNSDGKQDVFAPSATDTWQVLTYNGSNLSVALGGIGAPTAAGWLQWLMDTNGDGRQDLVYALGQNIMVRLNTGTNFGTAAAIYSLDNAYSWTWNTAAGLFSNSDIQTADFNADGRTDMILMSVQNCGGGHTCHWPVYLYSQGAGYTSEMDGPYWDSNPGTGMRSTDVNGDGNTDIVYDYYNPGISGIAGDYSCIRYGTGAGLGSCVPSNTHLQYAKNSAFMDWNGDGREDLLFVPEDNFVWPAGPQNWWVQIANGQGYAQAVNTGIPPGTNPGYAKFADVDGDGQSDLIYIDTGNTLNVRLHNGATRANLVGAVTDGFGNNVTVAYASLTNSAVYTKGASASFPENDVQVPVQVVRRHSVSDGIGGSYFVDHSYEAARIHLQGRGPLGFLKKKSVDSRTNVLTTWTLSQSFPNIGNPSLIEAKQAAGSGPVISSVSITNNDLVTNAAPYNDRHYPYVSASTSLRKEVGGTSDGQSIVQTAVSTTVDSYGTPNNVTVTTTDQTGSGQTFTKQTANTLSNDVTNWCLGMVTQQALTSTVPGSSAQIRTTQYVADAANPTLCRVKQQIVEPSISASTVTTTLAFDAFGNANSQTVSATGITDRVTSISFGSTGVFPVSVTNAASETETRTFNYALGVPLTVTDPNGIGVTFQYDGFGRRTREIRADGTKTAWGYVSCNANNGYCGDSLLRYQVTEQYLSTADAPVNTRVSMLDALGRQRYEQVQTLSGAYSVVATRYDASGRVSQQSQPYFAGFPAYFTTFTYDLLNRPLTETRQISESNTGTQGYQYAYNRLVQSQTDPQSKATIRSLNAIGQVTQVTDALSQSTSYTYDAFGNLLTAKDPLNNTIANTYNIRGFKMTSADPDMGSWTYDYYRTGELKTQISPKMAAASQSVTFTYDKVSRPLTRAEPEGTTTWVWGASATNKDIGKPVCINASTTTSCTSAVSTYRDAYTYDSLGRLATTIARIDSTDYAVAQTYNSITGLLEQVTYPTSTSAVSGSRIKVKYEYANGILQRVKDDNGGGTVYWEQIATTAAGQPVHELFGNALNTYSTYDAVTGLLGSRTTGATSQVQNLTYQWDKVGNLTQRKDVSLNLTEDFTYDDIYRLDFSKLNNVINQDLTYNAAGNITYKLDVGSFTYPASGTSSVRPHAVTGAGTNNSYLYDANGNMTSRTIAGGTASTTTWFSYDLPNRINKGGTSTYAQFYYGGTRARYKQVAVTAAGGPLPSGTETTLYVGGVYEKVTKPSGTTEYKHSIIANGQIVALRTLRSSGTNDIRYMQKDHLGSVAAITSESGSVVLKLSYDAFGKRRNPTTWSGSPSAGDWTSIAGVTHRGYTEHEALDNVDLIHMNGRVYDPVIGRFTSADPLVAHAFNSQGLNRYSYVMNNPLSLVDPSGFCDDAPTGFNNRDGSLKCEGVEEIIVTARDHVETIGSIYSGNSQMIQGPTDGGPSYLGGTDGQGADGPIARTGRDGLLEVVVSNRTPRTPVKNGSETSSFANVFPMIADIGSTQLELFSDVSLAMSQFSRSNASAATRAEIRWASKAARGLARKLGAVGLAAQVGTAFAQAYNSDYRSLTISVVGIGVGVAGLVVSGPVGALIIGYGLVSSASGVQDEIVGKAYDFFLDP